LRRLTHASPRARRALITRTAGVGITALATVAAGVATASSSNADVWDSVAACESGGNWSISTGNGYYGGLQFSRSTWLAYGGAAYGSTANQASREQQIAVAQRVLAGQGPGAWPNCGPRAGLTRGGGGATSASTTAARSSTRTSTATTTRTRTTAAKATKKAATKAPATRTTRTASVAASGQTLTVRAGDTLSELAAARGISGGWKALFAVNRDRISNPDLIYVGQVLKLPA
jgi:nucleoid-associated protein YgaU